MRHAHTTQMDSEQMLGFLGFNDVDEVNKRSSELMPVDRWKMVVVRFCAW